VANVRIGFCGGDLGSSYLLPRIVGKGLASELMLTGRFIGAEEAARVGLVSRVVAADELIAQALHLAGEIAANSPWAVRMTKQVLACNLDAGSLRAAIELENRTQILSTRTADFGEAMSAFLEKRAPQYTGS
jgi:enoyl-CoA hydratase